ncbi:non-ribosomal peptide synthetase [Nonomuraea sp. NEAU-A123]|uniref:non-ribosomal peptide synthetase n=1 Tax=Nonomuraea sp. NEAU-A123 TaxID=2839649 RepID=UPI001BE4C3E8|nr:non-ribosomal peptide synthetase [Nonomuraea sp. NEAU-A123]MBT2227580.1 amino acid adenylation domain-containing protein [Nonomuraea sp. NEAU-A123]
MFDSEIGRRVAEHAAQAPDSPAVVSAEGVLTYRDLATRAERYREALAEAGLRAGDVVAMALPDGAVGIAAMLAAFTAGTAFVWLDEDQPAARHRAILEDCGPTGVVATPNSVAQAAKSAGCPAVVTVQGDEATVVSAAPSGPRAETVPRDTSCLVYTSGSTGRPKGIVQRSGNLLHFARWLASETGLRRGSHMLQLARLSYDAAYLEILSALDSGAAIVIPPPTVKPDGAALLPWLAGREVTHVFCVPTLIRRLLLARESADEPPDPGMRAVSLYGEPLHSTTVEQVRAHFPQAAVYNMYGPAETTVATFHLVEPDCAGDIPIGRDIPGVETLLRGGESATDDEGEVWIRTRFLARGYLGRPAETAAVFSEKDESGLRTYRTGDLARRRPDGALVFLGRRDHQVKIRGARVELAEIEAVLRAEPGVAQAAVGVFTDEQGTVHPAAYLEPVAAAKVDVRVLHRRLAGVLPAYMVPAAYVLLDKLPLTATGKIDRNGLPDPNTLTSGTGAQGAFKTGTERRLAAIWREVLDRQELGADDDFFELKGHSLMAVRIAAAVIEEFGVEIPVRAVFEHPTVRELAGYIDEELSHL